MVYSFVAPYTTLYMRLLRKAVSLQLAQWSPLILKR